MAKTLSVPEKHQKKIALQTLKYSDAGAKIMGGMTKDEAKKFLKSIGYNDRQIKKLEESKLMENDLRQLIRTMIEQEMDKVDVGDEEDIDEKKCEDEELEEVSTTGDVEGYQTPYAFAGKHKEKQKQNAEQLGYKLVNEPEDRDWKDLEDARKEPLVWRKKFGENIKGDSETMSESVMKEEKFTIEMPKDVQIDKKDFKQFVAILKKNKIKYDIGLPFDENMGDLNEVKVGTILKHNLSKAELEVTKVSGNNITTKILKTGSINAKVGQINKTKKQLIGVNYTILKEFDENIQEGRRGVYQNYRDDENMTTRQKIGESLRNVRNQLTEIEKTIDLNLRLKQETGINSQQYWKRTHRALNRINERMTRIINKIRRF